MPEGDTIHKIAAAMRPRLLGETLLGVRMRGEPSGTFTRGWRAGGPEPEGNFEGRVVKEVYALGKHLIVALDDGLLLRSHLGMHGAWHRYRPQEPWRKPEWRASLTLWTHRDVFVCFDARDVAVLKAGSVDHANFTNRLGPDLLAPALALSEVIRRTREFCQADASLVDVLLDQRAASGIGNVYKSEVLFIARQHPLAKLASQDDQTLGHLYQTARSLLRRNLGGGPRVTRFENDGRGRLWVYRRQREPCLICKGEIRRARLGTAMRSTYWCPNCQREAADDPGAKAPAYRPVY